MVFDISKKLEKVFSLARLMALSCDYQFVAFEF
jgi:hypothetical protein